MPFIPVQRLHAYRRVLPARCRLPGRTLWGGASAAELVGDVRTREVENRTPRIHPDVMEVLLSAALLTVETIGTDLAPIAQQLLRMRTIAHQIAPPEPRLGAREAGYLPIWALDKHLTLLLEAFAQQGQTLPGVVKNGRLTLDAVGITVGGWLERDRLGATRLQRIVECGLPLQRNLLRLETFSRINGHPWRTQPVDADEIRRLIRHVITAAFLILTYLSGIRTGEKRAELRLMQHSTTETTR